jgi:hypothetical protein
MTLGQMITELLQIANDNPAMLSRPVMVDDGDGILGAAHFAEAAYSTREDDISGERVGDDDSRDKYLVTLIRSA